MKMIGEGMRLLRYFWQLPQHLIGLGLLLLVRGKVLRMEYFHSVKVYVLGGTRWAVSLGEYVFVSNWHKRSVWKHEWGHSRQSLILGPFYLLVVGIPSFLRATIWFLFRLPSCCYRKGFPESWADSLGGL